MLKQNLNGWMRTKMIHFLQRNLRTFSPKGRRNLKLDFNLNRHSNCRQMDAARSPVSSSWNPMHYGMKLNTLQPLHLHLQTPKPSPICMQEENTSFKRRQKITCHQTTSVPQIDNSYPRLCLQARKVINYPPSHCPLVRVRYIVRSNSMR